MFVEIFFKKQHLWFSHICLVNHSTIKLWLHLTVFFHSFSHLYCLMIWPWRSIGVKKVKLYSGKTENRNESLPNDNLTLRGFTTPCRCARLVFWCLCVKLEIVTTHVRFKLSEWVWITCKVNRTMTFFTSSSKENTLIQQKKRGVNSTLEQINFTNNFNL